MTVSLPWRWAQALSNHGPGTHGHKLGALGSCIRRNPALGVVSAKYMDLHAALRAAGGPASFPRLSEIRGEEVCFAITHSFVMHAITEYLLYEKKVGQLGKG